MGNAATSIALAWLVYDLTGSAADMGIVMALYHLPLIGLVLVGGVTADRLPRRTVLLASDAARFLMVGAVAWLIWAEQIELWHIFVLSAGTGAASAFFFPAYTSVLPDLVPADELIASNSLNGSSTWLAEVVGPALGALLVATGGFASAFAFDAATFGFSALLLLGVPRVPVTAPEGSPSALREVVEGFRAVRALTWLWVTIVIYGLIGALDEGAYSVVLPQLVQVQLGGGVEGLGLIRSALGIGLVVGAVYMGQRSMPRLRGVWIYLSTCVAGLALAGMGVTSNLYVAVGLAVVTGACWAIVVAIWDTSIQDLVPQHLRGRVRSIDFLGAYVLLPVGTLASGFIADAAGPTVVFLIGGLGTTILAACGLLVRDVRTFGSDTGGTGPS
jgi:MFS family permease